MDDDLLRRCQHGDAKALGELIRRHQDRVFRLAVRVLRDPARAEDAVADAFALVWSRCGSWRGEAAAATWIHQVAYRVILDQARTRRRWWRIWSRAEAESRPPVEDPAAVLLEKDEQSQRVKRLDVALQELSLDDRALVHLHYFEEQSLAEIATVLETTRDALKMRLSRARAKLRELLGDDDDLFG